VHFAIRVFFAYPARKVFSERPDYGRIAIEKIVSKAASAAFGRDARVRTRCAPLPALEMTARTSHCQN